MLEIILEHFPEAAIETDLDGQIIIYTGEYEDVERWKELSLLWLD